jgi:hypothetical protein
MCGDVQLASDLLGGQTAGEHEHDLQLPVGELVRFEQNWNEITLPRRLDGHCYLPVAALVCLEEGGIDHEPAAPTGLGCASTPGWGWPGGGPGRPRR